MKIMSVEAKMAGVAKRGEGWAEIFVAVPTEKWNKETRAMELQDDPFKMTVVGRAVDHIDTWDREGGTRLIDVEINGEIFQTKDGEERLTTKLKIFSIKAKSEPRLDLGNGAAPAKLPFKK